LDDRGYAIGVDGAGNAYFTGSTGSANFPTASPVQPAYGGGYTDAFVTKLASTGSALAHSTFLGGTDYDYAQGIGVDGAGNAYVTGTTLSTNFPVAQNPFQSIVGGYYDAFVAKIDSLSPNPPTPVPGFISTGHAPRVDGAITVW